VESVPADLPPSPGWISGPLFHRPNGILRRVAHGAVAAGFGEERPLGFTFTNKIYGGIEAIALNSEGGIYYPSDMSVRANGIDELRPLDLHTPYSCSKGAAGQYIIDYARTFGLLAVRFRMSCIAGLIKWGNEDQGWVAHFLIRALEGQTITLYGDGKRCRVFYTSKIW
jgi:CDP-paratose 2-epimerase